MIWLIFWLNDILNEWYFDSIFDSLFWFNILIFWMICYDDLKLNNVLIWMMLISLLIALNMSWFVEVILNLFFVDKLVKKNWNMFLSILFFFNYWQKHMDPLDSSLLISLPIHNNWLKKLSSFIGLIIWKKRYSRGEINFQYFMTFFLDSLRRILSSFYSQN